MYMLAALIPLVNVIASLQAKQVSAANSRFPDEGLLVLIDFLSIQIGTRCFETLAGWITAVLLPVNSQTYYFYRQQQGGECISN